MKQLITKKQWIGHRRPTPDGFFSGRSGRQALIERTYFLGVVVWDRILDEEIVPHYHYVGVATLGFSSWTSRLCVEYPEAARMSDEMVRAKHS